MPSLTSLSLLGSSRSKPPNGSSVCSFAGALLQTTHTLAALKIATMNLGGAIGPLKELSVRDNQFPTGGNDAKSLLEALKLNQALTSFACDQNALVDEAASDLADILAVHISHADQRECLAERLHPDRSRRGFVGSRREAEPIDGLTRLSSNFTTVFSRICGDALIT